MKTGSCFLVSKLKKSFYDGTRLQNKPNLRNPFRQFLSWILLTVPNFKFQTLRCFSACFLDPFDQANKNQSLMQSKLTPCKSDHKIAWLLSDQFGMIKWRLRLRRAAGKRCLIGPFLASCCCLTKDFDEKK